MSLGGSQTTRTELPAWVQAAAQQNLARADEISRIGHVPFAGPEVAALTPDQHAAMQNTRAAAQAFGLAGAAPQTVLPPTVSVGGVSGYSSAPLFEAALARLREQRPGQYDAINAMFLNPFTGAVRAPMPPYTPAPPASVAYLIRENDHDPRG